MMLEQLIRANKTTHGCHYSLPAEVEIDGMERCKAFKTL